MKTFDLIHSSAEKHDWETFRNRTIDENRSEKSESVGLCRLDTPGRRGAGCSDICRKKTTAHWDINIYKQARSISCAKPGIFTDTNWKYLFLQKDLQDLPTETRCCHYVVRFPDLPHHRSLRYFPAQWLDHWLLCTKSRKCSDKDEAH